MAEQAGHDVCADILRHYMAKIPEGDEVVSHAVEINTKDNDAKAGVLSRVLGFLRGSSPEVAK